MAVFITGAGGFIGQALVTALAEQGKEVLAFDFNPPKEEVLSRWKGKAEFVQGDIRDAAKILDLVKASGNKDPIIHLAAMLTAGCDRDPRLAIEVNLGGTFNILEGALQNGKRPVILASTIGVYGRGLPQPITEEMPLEPDGWYGATKQSAEQMGLLYARRQGLDFRAGRFAAVTGPNRVAQGSASLFTSLIPEKAARGEHYDIEVSEDTSYPVVYIRDAVEALLKLMEAPAAPSRIYNFASGNVVVKKMVSRVKELIPSASFAYTPVEDIMAVVSAYKEWTIDCSRAERELGWKPRFGVEAMVEDIIRVIRSQ
ncbi:MAG: NAD(P)-dependent oxidoreductase [Treponema sp.]|nr:NAD(P)-dependent oxidoreductase [Treponema sp.]